MKTKFILFFSLLFNINFYCQIPEGVNKIDENNLREGEWIIYYDEDWQEVEDSSEVEYYRKITYHKDKPIGLVCDFYKTGVKQWEGYLTSDRPDFSNGWVRYYYDNGNIEMEGMVKKNKNTGEWKNYTYLGKFSHISFFKKGVEQGFSLKLNEAYKLYNKGNFENVITKLEEVLEDLKLLSNYNENNVVAEKLFEIADLYLYLEKYNDAINLNEKSLVIRKGIYGLSHPAYIESLMNLGLNYLYIGQYKKSLYYNNKCLNIAEKIYGKYHSDCKTCLSNLAIAHLNLGQFQKALELNKECLSIDENLYGKEHPDYLLSLNNLAGVYNELGQYEKSLGLNKRCLALNEIIYGKEHPEYARSLNNLAMNYSDLGQFKKSLALNISCSKIREKLFGKEHSEYANSLNNLALNYSNLGQYEKSLSINRECLALMQKIYGQAHPDYVNSLSNLALNYSDLGQYEESLILNKKCLILNEKIFGKEHLDYARTLNNLAHVYSNLGQYEKSLALNLECLVICENLVGKENRFFLTTLNNLAQDYSNLGNYQKSLDLNKKCIALAENIFGKEHRDYARSLNNLALDYSNLGQYERSLFFSKECLNITELMYGKEHPDYFSTLNNLAQHYSDLGQYEKSLEMNKECLRLIEIIYGKQHPDYALSLNNLALNYSDLGDNEKSYDLIKESLELNLNLYGKEHPSYALSLSNFALENVTLGNYKSCDSLFVQQYKIVERLFAKNEIGLSEKEKEKYINELKSDFGYLTNYTIFRKQDKPNLVAEVSSARLNLKGVLLSSNQQIKYEVFNTLDTSLINLYDRWKLGRLQLGKYYETTHQELDKIGVDLKAEEERVNALEQELSRRSLSFKKSQKRYTWEDLKSKLNSDEAYVELIRTDYYDFKNDRYTDSVYYSALIIDNNTTEHPVLLVMENGVQLEKTAYQYYSSHTAGKNKQYIDEYSYQNYWSIIAEKLKGKKKVYVSPDGVYNKINLNVLFNKETGNYLFEEMDIRLVTSGRDLFKTFPKKEKNKELTAVLVGSPKYDMIEKQAQDNDLLVSRDLQQNWIDSLSRGWNISSLPGTGEEVRYISDLMTVNKWKVTIYTDEEALEGNIKKVSSPTVLHIATHGYFFNDVMLKKNKSNRTLDDDSKKAIKNPLLRSGLLFAGAKNTLNGNPPKNGDNGLLTAYEASFMNLRGTDLVVLSACETARGEIKNGEGVYGLQRAMQQAGAKNIIMSMWKVNDKVTQEFMTMFYDSWLSGSTKREAFKSTQQKIKEIYKHPYYWGAFVMIGN